MRLRAICENSWATEADLEQMRRDPPEDPSRLFHVTTDMGALVAGGDVGHTSEFGRQGFHVFDNVDDAEYYLEMLRRKGFAGAEVVEVSVPLEHLKPDNASMGRAYIAPGFLSEYIRR